MFRKDVKTIDELLHKFLREQGFETPLNQKRLINSWGKVTGSVVEKYTGDIYIKNQTLFVKILNPALREDLSMMRSQLVKRLNDEVGAIVIASIKIY